MRTIRWVQQLLLVAAFSPAALSQGRSCGESLQGSGKITSPNYPDYYSNGENCMWSINATGGQLIKLEVVSFSTEPCCDFLSIFDSGADNPSERLSGVVGREVYTLGAYASIKFTSDSSVTYPGFVISFSSIAANSSFPIGSTAEMTASPFPDSCGGLLQGSGTIVSPNYPGHYLNGDNCIWFINATAGQVIQLEILSFLSEGCCDYLSIFDSGATRPSERLSGDVGQLVLTLGPYATLQFVSDFSVTYPGFILNFSSTAAPTSSLLTTETVSTESPIQGGCGGSLESRGTITSPNYPDSYPNYADCSWSISASPGQTIQLDILAFSTEACCDYVIVYDSGASSSPQRLSGTMGQTHLKLGHHVVLQFISDGSVASTGFVIDFSSAPAPPPATESEPATVGAPATTTTLTTSTAITLSVTPSPGVTANRSFTVISQSTTGAKSSSSPLTTRLTTPTTTDAQARTTMSVITSTRSLSVSAAQPTTHVPTERATTRPPRPTTLAATSGKPSTTTKQQTTLSTGRSTAARTTVRTTTQPTRATTPSMTTRRPTATTERQTLSTGRSTTPRTTERTTTKRTRSTTTTATTRRPKTTRPR